MNWINQNKFSLITLIISSLLSICMMEIGIRYIIVGEPRLFQAADKLGWTLKSNLDIQRKSISGNWRVWTDKSGVRTNSSGGANYDAEWIILGDSFAFGEGVNIEDRFDFLNKNLINSSLNLGVMGYSPLQAFLRLEEVGVELTERHKVIFLIYENDIEDSISFSNAYRKRPVLSEGAIVLPNQILDRIHGFLRDKSYIYFGLMAYIIKPETKKTSNSFLDNMVWLENMSKSKTFYIFHGFDESKAFKLSQSFFCENVKCVFYNANKRNSPNLFFKDDIHWNAKGNLEFSQFLQAEVLIK